jgi:hypothetical protein
VNSGAYPIRDDSGGGGVEFAVEVQERKTMNQGPDRGRHRFRVGAGKAPLDDGPDVLGDGGGSGDPFGAVLVTGFSEHHPKQCGPLERELDVGDGDGGKVVGG